MEMYIVPAFLILWCLVWGFLLVRELRRSFGPWLELVKIELSEIRDLLSQ